MKKAMLLVATLLVATIGLALEKGETEIENNGWFRYTAGMKNLDFADLSRNDFNLERGYIRLSHQWTNALFAKMTIDVFGSGDYADGATIRLKEAYVDWTLPIAFLDVRLTPGLQKHYFSLVYSWDYTHLERSLADKNSVAASSDFGVTVNGFLPQGLGEFQLSAYNGEGYKKVFYSKNTQMNTDMEYAANLRLTPVTGVTVGASVMTNKSDRSGYKNTSGIYYKPGSFAKALGDTANVNRQGLAPMAKLALGPVSVLGEYISFGYTRQYSYYKTDSAGRVVDSTKFANTRKYAQSGISVVPVVSLLNKKLELVGRYDMWNTSAEHGEAGMVKDTLKSYTMIGAGFNYHLVRREKNKPGVELQFMWQREQAVARSQKPSDLFMAQVRFEWTGLITPQQ